MHENTHPFHVMVKPTGPLCNLDCSYCFYLEKDKLYPGESSWTMPDDVLEMFIRQYIQSQPLETITFAWQGGEPLILKLDFFREVVRLQKEWANGKRIENTLQTNGILLDDDWGQFLAENEFLVGISIDGPHDIHDRYRLDRAGKPTLDRVLHGLELLKKHGVAFNTLTCVHRQSARKPLEVYRFLKNIGSRFLQFIPVVERIDAPAGPDGLRLVSPDAESAAEVSEWSVLPEDFGRFLCAIFDEWVCKDVGEIFVQIFDVALESWVGMPSSLCVFGETCGAALALEHNGDLYSCDHYVYPENRLGNIMTTSLRDLAHSGKQCRFGADKFARLPRECLDCQVRFACHGECPKHRFAVTAAGEPGMNYLCAGYKRFFTHIDPAMRFMAGELRRQRAPANVMKWIRVQSQGRPGRNDPCPCGSGRKYKKCCGSNP